MGFVFAGTNRMMLEAMLPKRGGGGGGARKPPICKHRYHRFREVHLGFAFAGRMILEAIQQSSKTTRAGWGGGQPGVLGVAGLFLFGYCGK